MWLIGVDQQTTIELDASTTANEIDKRVARRNDLISIRFIVTIKYENDHTKKLN